MVRWRQMGLRLMGAAFLITILYFTYHGHRVAVRGGEMAINLWLLPYYAYRSLLRMLGAYVLSLAFTLVYGYRAGTDPAAARWMIPVLDILQSVPILGFFPAAIYFFVYLFRGGALGVELASIFLIFTSQAWNMTFGFYEALTTLPAGLKEAATAYGLRGFLRFWRLYLPAGIPKLVYNSILSWAGGWYFLIAAEIISIGPVQYTLPGLGSFLIKALGQGQVVLALLGLFSLIFLITLLNAFVWQPLSLWAERYKYDVAGGGFEGRPRGIGYQFWRYLFSLSLLRWALHKGWSALLGLLGGIARWGERVWQNQNARWVLATAGWTMSWAVRLGLLFLAIKAFSALAQWFRPPWAPEIFSIPQALLFSFLRLLGAYLLSLLWTLPMAVWLGHRPEAERLFQPIFQIMASVPATALFPLVVFFLIRLAGGIDLAAIVLVLTGMQWYLLFNLVAGVKSIPKDLKEAAFAYGVRGFPYFWKVVLPALIPSLVTGSITAWGGGWNAIIVSEYVVYGGQTFTAFGIGSLLDQATYATGNFQVIWMSLLAMVTVILLLNHLFWRPIFNLASRKYRLEV